MKQSTLFWTILFSLILLLSQIPNLLAFDTKALFLGLPSWIWYFIGVHFILVIALYFFSKNYLNEKEQ